MKTIRKAAEENFALVVAENADLHALLAKPLPRSKVRE